MKKYACMASWSSVLIVSERGRYCSSGVLSFRRMRVNLPVDESLDSSHMPAQLFGTVSLYVVSRSRHVHAGYSAIRSCVLFGSYKM